MLIYTENKTPRIEFVLEFIFREAFGIDYKVTDSREDLDSYTGPKINYSVVELPGILKIPFSGILAEKSLRQLEPVLLEGEGFKMIFPQEEGNPEFDPFASVFYMISRYEEYLPYIPDQYGRFPSEESFASRNGILEKPVVDIWIEELRMLLNKSFPSLKIPGPKFSFLPTSDIDIPYAYLHRGRLRTAGARFKAFLKKSPDRQLRKEVLKGRKPDPFDTYSEMEAVHALYKLRPRVFFLTSAYGKHDKSISPWSRTFSALVNNVKKFAELGIHPSFRSSVNNSLIRRELNRLNNISGLDIKHTRQHYLRFNLPASYRLYADAGLDYEYSMGFASGVGFRAGTSRSFAFYDLQRDSVTELKVIPFHVMDRTLKDYMGLKPDDALARIIKVSSEVKKYGGSFCTIWHNDAFSDFGEWKGWKDVYLQMLEHLQT